MKTFTPKTAIVFSKAKKRPVEPADGRKIKVKKSRPRAILVDLHGKEIVRQWVLIDAKDQILGRLATRVANLLRGKHKTVYVPYDDVGDFVVVVNASQILMTGLKADNKLLYRHSGYPGGLRSETYGDLRDNNPDRMLRAAVKTMLPRNKLRARYLRKLKVYAGAEHPHVAQQPRQVEFTKTAAK